MNIKDKIELRFSFRFLLKVIHFLVISVIILALIIILFGWDKLHTDIINTLDKLKSIQRYTVSLPVFFTLNILMILFCLPLSPVQLFTGYCLGGLLGVLINFVGTIIGILLSLCIHSITKIFHNILYKFHEQYCKNCDAGGFAYIFLTIAIGKLNIGSAIQLSNKRNKSKTIVASVTSSLIFSFFFGYVGNLIDPFVLFVDDTKDYSVIIQLVVMFAVAVICHIGARYWYFYINPSSKYQLNQPSETTEQMHLNNQTSGNKSKHSKQF